MRWRFSKRASSATLLVLMAMAGAASASIIENFGLAHNAAQTITGPITGGGTLCKKVTNNSPTGKQVYVPGSTAAEWQSFVASPPSGVVLGSCCGGSYTISSNQVNLNLFSYAGSPSCTGGSYTFTISPGVTVYSNNTAMPALTTGTWPSGTTLTLVNGGSIIGMGGAGGSGNITPAWSGNPGYPGGDAVSVTTNVTITNNGMIAGGGGGGGGGAQTVQRFGQQGAGGGGGQSFSPSAGGGGVNISGAGGTQSSGGNGGGYFDPYGIGGAAGVNGTTGNAIGTYVCGGGGGGGYGAYGGTGATHGQVPGAGGAPGKAVNANGNTITWLAAGTRYGAVQ